MFTRQAVDLMRDIIAQSAMDEQELRRLVGMGAMYISRSGEQPERYKRWCSIEIDDARYFIYKDHGIEMTDLTTSSS